VKPSIKINKIELRDELFTSDSNKKFSVDNLTLIVGPNNAGKSQILKDIHFYLVKKAEMKLVKEVELDFPRDVESVTKLLEPLEHPYEKKSHGQEGDIALKTITVDSENQAQNQGFNLPILVNGIVKNGLSQLLPQITKFFTLRLNGRNRFQLISNQQMGDFETANTTLQKIQQNKEIKKKIKRLIFDEFDQNFYISVSNGEFQIRLSPEYSEIADTNMTHPDSIKFFRNIPRIEDMGDGIQCFTGLIMALHSVDSTMLFIDEPEAFLHPPQAKHLAHNFVETCKNKNSSVLVSTHSSNFLMGCLEKSNKLKIIRMSFDGKIGTVKVLDSNEVNELSKDPVLRSTKTLEAIFHKSTIIVESDGDRVLYEEINRRLVMKERGIEDTTFINGMGKDNLHRIVAGLRKLGVPTACIYDLDFINLPKESKKDMWEKRLKIFGFEEEEISNLNNERKFLLEEFEKQKTEDCANPIKAKRIFAFSGKTLERARKFLTTLSSKGLHLVPVGELEEWLAELDVEEKAQKIVWITKILEKLEKDDSEEFVEPKENGVWKFIEKINCC